MGYAELIICLQRIERASVVYRNEPPSPDSHSALMQSLVEAYPVIAEQERGDPIIDYVRWDILRTCRSIVHALDFGVMEHAPDAPSRRMASDYCEELAGLTGSVMPYLQAVASEREWADAS